MYWPYRRDMEHINQFASQYAHLWMYFLLVLGIVMLPGMDMAFVMSNALAAGRRAGFAAVGGLMLGGLAHTVLSVLGVSMLVNAHPLLYTGLAIAGTAYMAWIGLGMARSPGALLSIDSGEARPSFSIIGRGFASCMLNPKAYLFNVAVTPQFVRPDMGDLPGQALSLALIVIVVQALIYGIVAFGAGLLRRRLSGSAHVQKTLMRGIGGFLIATAAGSLWRMLA
jgi:threonine/homoserine/homoserine lactone efflux protein